MAENSIYKRPWPYLGSGQTSYRHASLIDRYLHTEFHPNRTTKTFHRSHRDFDQVQGHVTWKLGPKLKIRLVQIQILIPSLRIYSHSLARTINGGGDKLWKWAKSQLPRAHDLGSGQMSYRRASLIDFYLHTKFHPNWTTKTFHRSHRDFDQVQGHVT